MKGRPSHRLRQQVARERKIRGTVFFVVMTGVFVYMGISLLLGDMGLIKYLRLRETRTALQSEVREMEKENGRLSTQIKALKNDPYYIEKQAREEFGLARPDEFIFQFQEPDKGGNER